MTSDLALAAAAAREAGTWLKTRLQGCVVLSWEGRDAKVEADIEAERMILQRLRAHSAHPILSEENGGDASESSPVSWVVDPLDGTVNLTRGVPLSAVSIALCHGSRPMLGVVYDFHRNELFAAGVGATMPEGAVPLQVSTTAEKRAGILATGFPSARAFDDGSLGAFVSLLQDWKKVRLLGSAALSLAWVAAGRFDAYAEDDIFLWDVAAGLALVEAAGGVVRCDPGAGGWRRTVRAANREIGRSWIRA